MANLRGAKESGRIFAPPTYLYVATMSLLVVWGLYKTIQPGFQPLPIDHGALSHFFTSGTGQAVTAFLLLRAFASGAVALSGVEAISNGVQAFKKPQSRNAALTLLSAAVILGVLFAGIAELTYRVRPTLSPDQTILSQLGHYVFGHGALYLVLQASTAAILTLSANTAFADFPRLSGIIARDNYMPRQLAHRGDRLVLSNGIIVLAVAAGVLYVGFDGDITALIPLFAVGLFSAFTLSQTGMVVHWWHVRGPSWPAEAGRERSRRHHDAAGDPDRGHLQVHRGGVDPHLRHPDHRGRLPGRSPPLRPGRGRHGHPARPGRQADARGGDRAGRRARQHRRGAGPVVRRGPEGLVHAGPLRRVRRRRRRADEAALGRPTTSPSPSRSSIRPSGSSARR